MERAREEPEGVGRASVAPPSVAEWGLSSRGVRTRRGADPSSPQSTSSRRDACVFSFAGFTNLTRLACPPLLSPPPVHSVATSSLSLSLSLFLSLSFSLSLRDILSPCFAHLFAPAKCVRVCRGPFLSSLFSLSFSLSFFPSPSSPLSRTKRDHAVHVRLSCTRRTCDNEKDKKDRSKENKCASIQDNTWLKLRSISRVINIGYFFPSPLSLWCRVQPWWENDRSIIIPRFGCPPSSLPLPSLPPPGVR